MPDPQSFPKIGSARDALVPLFARRIKVPHTTRADEGVGRGRGRPPYNFRRCS